jgi:hypothetical protein
MSQAANSSNGEITSASAANGRLREQAIEALLNCRSVGEAAKKIGRSRKTLERWLDDADFSRAYQEEKRRVLLTGIARLTSRVSMAVDVLTEVAKQRGRPHQGARAASAAAIIKLALDSAMVDDIEQRLERLERHRTDDE